MHQSNTEVNGRTSSACRGICAAALLLLACGTEQRLEQSRLGEFSRFGRDVAVSGLTAVVGAYQEDGAGGSGTGAAYVFTRGGSRLSIQARLESPSPTYEQFGDAVAIADDTIAVGATLTNQTGAVRAGAVYIFERGTGGEWTHSQTLSSPPPRQAWEAYGASLAMVDNLLVVGAPARDKGAASDAGAAYVYERLRGNFSLVQELTQPGFAAQDNFGAAVGIAGDRVVVGAPRRDTRAGTNAGQAHVYVRQGFNYALLHSMQASDGAANDRYGSDIALQESDDGGFRLVIGAPQHDTGGLSNAGAAYLYDALVNGQFIHTDKLTAGDGAVGDLFGGSVALDGDIALVGAAEQDAAATRAGAGYVFELAGTWTETAKLVDSTPQTHALMGSSVALGVGGFALLGATGAETPPVESDSGNVHVFRRDTGGAWLASHVLTASGEQAPQFGRHIDVDAEHLIVCTGTGPADLLVRDADGYSLSEVFEAEAASNAGFWSAAVSGDTLALFARRGTLGPANGYIDVRVLSGGDWVLQQTLEPDLSGDPFPLESAYSTRLALQGDTLVAGAPRYHVTRGRVFVYERGGTVWGAPQVLESDAPNNEHGFGKNVAVDGDWIAVSEVPNGGVEPRYGKVFTYSRQGGSFVQEQILTAPSPQSLDRFGAGLAMSGELLAVVTPPVPATATETMLRVYRRTGSTYNEVWNIELADAGVGGTGSWGIAMTDDLLALGMPARDNDAVADAGAVVLYTRQFDDTYLESTTYRATDASTNLGLGAQVALSATEVIATTAKRVYAFDMTSN